MVGLGGIVEIVEIEISSQMLLEVTTRTTRTTTRTRENAHLLTTAHLVAVGKTFRCNLDAMLMSFRCHLDVISMQFICHKENKYFKLSTVKSLWVDFELFGVG